MFNMSPSHSRSLRDSWSLLRAAAPIGAFYLTEILVGLTDLAVVGALGVEPLAAVGLGKMIFLSLLTIGFGVISVGTVLMSERPTPERRGQVLAGTMLMALTLAGASLAVGAFLPSILAFAGYEAGLLRLVDDYTSILAWVVGPAMVFAALKNVLVSTGRTGAIAWLSASIVLANLGASVLLVHGAGSWSGLGVAGAAWATIGVNIAAATILALHVVRRSFVRFAGVKMGDVLASAREIAALGWAAGAQHLLETMLFVVVLALLGLYSTVWLAAGSVVFAVMELNYASSSAIGEVLMVRIASARARFDRPGAMDALRLGATLAGAIAVVFATGIGLFPGAVISLFAGPAASDDARALMASLLQWTAPAFLFDAGQIVFAHALRGYRHIVRPMVLSTACYWAVGLGGGVFLAGPAGLGAPGLWVGFVAGLACAALLLGAMAVRMAGKPIAGAE